MNKMNVEEGIDNQNWFVYYVQVGKEQNVCEFIYEKFHKNIIEPIEPFVPRVEFFFKKGKQCKKELRPMFPGYVFVKTSYDPVHFVTEKTSVLGVYNGVLKLLGKHNPKYMSINENEKQLILQLCNNDSVIELSTGYIKGDKIIIKSGPLKGIESIIKKIDRHKRTAIIELSILGDIRNVKVGIDIIQRIP